MQLMANKDRASHTYKPDRLKSVNKVHQTAARGRLSDAYHQNVCEELRLSALRLQNCQSMGSMLRQGGEGCSFHMRLQQKAAQPEAASIGEQGRRKGPLAAAALSSAKRACASQDCTGLLERPQPGKCRECIS